MVGAIVASLISLTSHVGSKTPVWVPRTGSTPKLVRILDARKITNFQECCLLASAEGLYNSEPNNNTKAYILWSDAETNLINWTIEHGYVMRGSAIASAQSLIEMTGTKSAIVWNEEPFHLGDIASTVAGCERALLVGNPELLSEYHLKTKLDLRNRFTSNMEAYQWLFRNYSSKINRLAVSITVPYQTASHNPYQLRDYFVANKIFDFWISGSKESQMAGADSKGEMALLSNILTAKFKPNLMCLGYPWSGDGYGPGEYDGVTFLSQAAKWLVATDNFTNLSFWTCFKPSDKKLPISAAAPACSSNQKYGSLVMSDGDNADTFQQFFPEYWKKLGASPPVGWTMSPTLFQLAPPIYDYNVSLIPAGSTVGSGVSGIGYMSMEEWGKSYGTQRDDVISGFLDQTSSACNQVGEKWLWIMRYGDPNGWETKDYATKVMGIRSVMGGYSKVTDDPSLAVERIGNVEVFNCLLDGGNLAQVEQSLSHWLAQPNAPQFYNIFMLNWNFPPDDIKSLAAFAESHGVKLVTPEQLGELANETIR